MKKRPKRLVAKPVIESVHHSLINEHGRRAEAKRKLLDIVKSLFFTGPSRPSDPETLIKAPAFPGRGQVRPQGRREAPRAWRVSQSAILLSNGEGKAIRYDNESHK